ncbi:MAG: bifunctional aspartate kinase/homoserine dehydrogenase II [Gammaproteobacteria bacterium]|nr:bifunctional aspartate kinase/homoserine dehydrogenase II [Gammaproteobacteria bacterium]
MTAAAPQQSLALHKFGGSSLADPQCYLRVANLLLTHSNPADLVVVSAAGKTTNKLIKLHEFARSGKDYQVLLLQLAQYQRRLIEQLLQQPAAVLELFNVELAHLEHQLAEAGDNASATVACGEVWSSRLLAALLNQLGRASIALDARDFLVGRGQVTPIIDEALSTANLLTLNLPTQGQQRVITGFICSDGRGETLLLGRNGSDYSATLIAKLAGANEVNIWTDVAGVFSADPNLIHEARLIEQLSLAEAEELARIGNPVLHRRTLQPLAKDKIALRVRSSFDPDSAFTEIGKRLGHVGDCIINGMTEVELYLLPDNALSQQLVAALPEQGFFPLVTSRHGHDILLGLSLEAAPAFEALLAQDQNIEWAKHSDCGLISLLDAGVSWYRKLFNKLFNKESAWPIVLSDNGLSLSAIVPSKRVSLLTYMLHHRIYSPSKRIGVVLLGAGNIGRCWLELFKQQQSVLALRFNVKLPLVAVVGSSKALIDFSGINPASWAEQYQQRSQALGKDGLLSALADHGLDELIMLDITADQTLSDSYSDILSNSYHLISANKLAGSSESRYYNQIKANALSNNCKWLYNASVGAGLPVLHAINDLRQSGDQIQSISGVFSGTLSWLFEHYDDSEAFSSLLLRARDLGITEPDPRDDLSGKDKQRKLLILAREAGFELELADIELRSMVPEQLAAVSLNEFISRASELDPILSSLYQTAKANDCVIRYVAKLEVVQGKVQASVGLEQLSNEHPCATLTPSDNIFVMTSQWYQANPLIIRGPGAGREVTAAAVQSDLFNLVKAIA